MTASRHDQSSSTRLHHSYDPLEDLEARWPGWEIRIIPDLLDDAGGRCSEIIRRSAQTIDVDRDAFIEDPEHAYAHVGAHLDLHLNELGPVMTRQQEDDANGLARLRLGREELW